MSHPTHYTPEFHEEPDSWHRHTVDEGEPQAEHGGKPNNFLLAIAFLASLGFVAAVILASFLYFQKHMTSLRQERAESTVLSTDFVKYRDTAQAALQDFSFATPDLARAGTVMVPAEEATKRVIARYGAQK
jgi:hypothetical protein